MPAARIALTPHEAAAVLQVTVAEARSLIERGELEDVGIRAPRVGLDRLIALVADTVAAGRLSPLAEFMLGELIAGRVAIPRPRSSHVAPPTLLGLVERQRERFATGVQLHT